MSIASSITTADQLLKAGDIGRCELVRGNLVMMSPAGSNHGFVASHIHIAIGYFVRKHGLGDVATAETGFVIRRNPDTVRAPDVAFVQQSRLSLSQSEGYFPGAPDLAVEVLSPSDAASEVLAKVEDWIEAGTRAVWIVDPRRHTVTIHRPNAPLRVYRESDSIDDEPLLPGFSITLQEIFRTGGLAN